MDHEAFRKNTSKRRFLFQSGNALETVSRIYEVRTCHAITGLEVSVRKYFGVLLALLDSVSRAHGMGLLSVVRPSVCPSVRRPCRNYL